MSLSTQCRCGVLLLALLLPVLGWSKSDYWNYHVVAEYPHNTEHFTQGLVWHEGRLFESTGLYGASAVYEKNLESGETLRQHALDRRLFGEGLTVHDRQLWLLTWREGLGLIFDLDLAPRARFPLRTEGWGLTGDGQRLWKTDGSATLYELDPSTARVIGQVQVRDGDRPIDRLNELEWIDGLIFANRFGETDIVIFDPDDGRVVGWLDLAPLAQGFDRPRNFNPREHVLNGIAWREDRSQLLVTGKSWPVLFALSLDWPEVGPSLGVGSALAE